MPSNPYMCGWFFVSHVNILYLGDNDDSLMAGPRTIAEESAPLPDLRYSSSGSGKKMWHSNVYLVRILHWALMLQNVFGRIPAYAKV